MLFLAGTGIVTVAAFEYYLRALRRHPPDLQSTILAGPGGTSVYAVAFSPDGQTLAVGSGDHTTRLWYVASHQPAQSGPYLYHCAGFAVPAGGLVALSPDRKTIAIGTSGGRVLLRKSSTPCAWIPSSATRL